MRFFCLLLLLVGVSASFLDWNMEKLRKKLAKLNTKLDVGRLLRIQQRLYSSLKAPKLNGQQKALLAQRLQKLRSINSIYNTVDESIENVNERTGMADLLYQGDIVLTEEQAEAIIEGELAREKRQATTEKFLKWPNRLYFSFNRNTSDPKIKDVARRGAKLWHDNTCVDLIEDPSAKERVEFFSGDGCWSWVGNLHKVQELSLGNGCLFAGTAAHEIAHALGLYHTQSRYDRDNYVTINVDNISEKELKTDFNKETRETSNNYDVPYDYGSVMHYSAKAFGLDKREPTIIPKDEDHFDTMGSPLLSFYDILLMNRYYGCLDKCKSSSAAKCKMGGYPNPRDCSKCICPGGYGGRLCDERPSGCGETLVASDKVQTLDYTFGKENDKLNEYEMCHFWIKAPRGRKVEIKLTNIFSMWTSNNGCSPAGIEIKSQRDQLSTGYRFCKQESLENGKKFVSNGDTVPVIFYRNAGIVEATLQYRTSMF